MKTASYNDLKIVPLTATEIARELRRRRDRLARTAGLRRLMAEAYNLVALDLDTRAEHEHRAHT